MNHVETGNLSEFSVMCIHIVCRRYKETSNMSCMREALLG